MRWDLLFFDLDGTLTDSGPGVMGAVRYAFGAMGRCAPDETEMRSFIGPTLIDSFSRYFLPEQAVEAVGKYNEYYAKTGWLENGPYPGIESCLGALRAAGARLFVATSKVETSARQVLDHFDLSPYFESVCGATADDPAHGAKDVVLRAALRQAGCDDPGRAVMIGDRKFDILGGRAAGLETVGNLYGYGSREELTAAGATEIVETVQDLQALLLQE